MWQVASGWWLVARSIAAVAAVVLATRYQILAAHLPRWPLREGLPKAVPMSVGFPGFFPQRALRKTGNPLFNPRAFFIPLLYTFQKAPFCEHGK